ncbi:MAG: hypothetical protein H6577_13860 [Lewinellaceae bacterium]|nr:hypothetical protein [Saprospiraceae bacterium]MCB9339212.1 hypothetical protein [Lewinellaceae bacterium]
MKNQTYCLMLFVLFATLISSCHQDHSTSNEEASEYTPLVGKLDSIGENIPVATDPLPTPPVDKATIERIKVNSNKSPFAKLGCCDDMDKWKQPCCCDKVVEKYREMVAAKDKKLGDLKSKDDILAQCRQMKKLVFDKIDHPEEEEEKF